MTTNQLDLWEISPADPNDSIPLYGNVAHISDWTNWQLGDEFFPVRLFVDHKSDSLDEVMSFLAESEDFIWSDDLVPWLTQKGAQILLSSGLTGFRLQKILITAVGNTSLEGAPTAKSPALFRVDVCNEFSPTSQSTPPTDFFMALVGGKRLGITQRAKTYLEQVGWQNFYAELLLW
ncbi:MAG TPA: hypothetical protein VGB45_11345 [Abditibacterium sp.]|jgi:hypothetical protein